METNIENLQYLLSKFVDINTGYLASIVAKDTRILSMQRHIDELELQVETLEKQWRAELPMEAEVSQ